MVNESTVYRPDTEHTKSMDVTLERFFPSNGTTFTKTSASFIEIPITVRKNGFLVPQETTVTLTWQAKPDAASPATSNFDVYASSAGTHALFNSVSLHQGANELECVSDWNRVHANVKCLYEDPYQATGNGTVRDPTTAMSTKMSLLGGTSLGYTSTYPNCRVVGKNLCLTSYEDNATPANPPVCNKFTATISLSALDLLGSSGQKLLPLSVANDFRLRLHLEKDVYKVYHALLAANPAAAGAVVEPPMPSSSSYEITEVSLQTKVIAYDDAMWEKMMAAVGNGGSSKILKWNGIQMRTSNVNTTYQSYVQEIVPNSQWTNLQSAICIPYLPDLSANGDNLAQCWGNGIYQAQFSIDGVQFPQLPVGEGDSTYPASSLSQLVMSATNCVRDACKSNNGNCMITPSTYPTGTVLASGASLLTPAGTSNCNDLVYTPPTAQPTNSQALSFPLAPTSAVAGIGSKAGKCSWFCAYGFNFTSEENGKLVQGIDTRGRQCNLNIRQSNSIPTGGAQPAVLCVQAIAVQYELDLNVGSITVRTQ
jgi:hypothetical protein